MFGLKDDINKYTGDLFTQSVRAHQGHLRDILHITTKRANVKIYNSMVKYGTVK